MAEQGTTMISILHEDTRSHKEVTCLTLHYYQVARTRFKDYQASECQEIPETGGGKMTRGSADRLERKAIAR